MTLTINRQVGLLLSVVICIGFGLSLLRQPTLAPPVSETDLSRWSPPRQPLDVAGMLAKVEADAHPFRARFFELVQFGGVIRRPDGGRVAVLKGVGGEPFLLPPGATMDGVTVVELDDRRCLIRVGGATRELWLPDLR